MYNFLHLYVTEVMLLSVDVVFSVILIPWDGGILKLGSMNELTPVKLARASYILFKTSIIHK